MRSSFALAFYSLIYSFIRSRAMTDGISADSLIRRLLRRSSVAISCSDLDRRVNFIRFPYRAPYHVSFIISIVAKITRITRVPSPLFTPDIPQQGERRVGEEEFIRVQL